MATYNRQTKKSVMGTVYEVLFILSFLGVSYSAYSHRDYSELLNWGLIPSIFLVLSVFYRSKEIGVALAAIFTYMSNMGINGLPAMAIILLVALAIGNYFSAEKLWSEMMKIVGGIASGSLAQAKISSNKSQNSN